MNVVVTPHASGALGPYSQGIVHNGMLFISGQLGMDYVSGLMPDDFVGQTELVFRKIKDILEAANMSFYHILKCTVYLTDLKDYDTMNEIYARYFSPPYPARETVKVAGLPKNAKIEISVIASR
ncbi:MAG: RidA family protein [Candidatus Cloacimonetes bacterium]|nr:RidA family protein [Candidatus Cloacimonadota bacterium]